MNTCPRLRPSLQVLCYVDTLSHSERLRLPTIIPYSWSLDKVQRIAKPSKRVIPFVPMIEEVAA
jgi:hypothetical protein